MANIYKKSLNPKIPMAGVTMALSAAALLGGCTAQVRVAAPPPPRVYVAPPPPPVVAVEPAVDVEVRATEAPPPLPDYEQPPCPEDGYLWTPGYWSWANGGYFWVPGTWVQPPRVGVLWTPGYWGFVGGVYAFHAGYWGPHIGFYGGVNYGFGYVGVGFAGGRWVGNSFAYNHSVTNVNVTVVHNTYNETVVNNTTVNNHVSFNGGAGGTAAVPTPAEKTAMAEPHTPPTPMQHQHVQEAAKNPALSAKANGGHPAIAATARPAVFSGPGVTGAHGAAPLPAHTPPPAAMNTAHAPTTPGGAAKPGQPGQPGAAKPSGGAPGAPAQGTKPPPPKPAVVNKPKPPAPKPKPQQQKKDDNGAHER
jgi:hypothetical protein